MKNKFLLVLLPVLFFFAGTFSSWGKTEGFREEKDAGTEWDDLWGEDEDGLGLPELELDKIQDFLDRIQGTGKLSFSDLMAALVKGDLSGAADWLFAAVKEGAASQMAGSVRLLAQAAALGILGAVFARAAAVFPSGNISETGFFIIYLLAFTCLTAGFFTGVETAYTAVGQVLEFMKVLLPSFFLTVAFAGGSISGAALYGSILTAAGTAQVICQAFVIPLVKVYVLFVLAGNLSREAFIMRLTNGLETGLRWSLKTMAGLFLGLQLIQTMILPYADSVKRAGIEKAVSAIPGIGGGAEAIVKAAVGSGVLLKNTVGGAAVVILAVLAAAPVAKLAFFQFLYQLAAALMEPVCDKRLTACVDGFGKAHSLLLCTVLTVVFLFAISIGLVCSATNAAYFAS